MPIDRLEEFPKVHLSLNYPFSVLYYPNFVLEVNYQIIDNSIHRQSNKKLQ